MPAAPPSWYRQPRWTKTSREKLAGVRHAHRSDLPDAVLDREAGWRWLAQYYDEQIHVLSMPVDERITAEPEFADAWQRLRATIAGKVPPSDLTPTGELLRAGIFLNMGMGYNTMRGPVLRALIGMWAGHDPALPLAVFREHGPYHVEGRYGGNFGWALRIVALTPNPHGHRSPVRLDDNGPSEIHLWAAYRAWLMAAPEAAFKIAHANAATLRDKLRAGDAAAQRSASSLAYAFSRDPAWATADAEALLAALDAGQRAPDGGFDLILPALTDPDLALRLAQRHGAAFGRSLGVRAFDVVESLGGHAAPVLAALLAQGHWSKHDRPQVAAALKLAETAP